MFTVPMINEGIISSLSKSNIESIDKRSLSEENNYLDSNFVTDQYNSINVFGNKSDLRLESTASKSGPNYIPGPRGVLVGNSRGYLSYMDESGNEIWESKLNISGYGKRLIGGYFSNNVNDGPAFYCLAQNLNGNGQNTMYVLSELDGTKIKESSNSFNPEQQWPDYFVEPFSGNEFNVEHQSSGAFIFSRQANNKDNLIKYYDSESNQISSITLDNWETSWKIMSAGWEDFGDKRNLVILFYDGSSVKLRFYQSTAADNNFTSFTTKTTSTVSGIDYLSADRVVTNSPSMYIHSIQRTDYDGSNIYVSFVLDFYEYRTWLVRVGVSEFSWNINYDITSFDQDGLNIDISNSKLMGDYFYCSASTSSYYSGSQIVKINVGQESNNGGVDYAPETKNYKTGADVFDGDIAYYNTNFGGDATSEQIVAAPFGNDPATSDIIAINYSQNKIQSKNYKNNDYLYKTKFTSDEINISDVINVNAIQINQEELNSSKYKDQIVEKITQYQDGSSFSIIKKPDNENQWSLGKIPVTVTVSKGYSGSSKTAETISIDTVLTGFKIISTELNPTVESNGIIANGEIATMHADEFVGSTSSLNSDNYNLLRTWIHDNINQIFVNYPTQIINESDISLVISSGPNSTSVSVEITLSKCYVNGIVASHTFSSIIINGFTQRQETSFIASNIDVSSDPTLSKKTVDTVTELEIENFIWNNKNLYFSSLPSNIMLSDIDVVFGEKKSGTGEIDITIYLNKYYDSNGVEQNITHGKQFSSTIVGLLIQDKGTIFSPLKTSVEGTSLTMVSPSNINDSNSDLKTFVANNLLINKPSDFGASNIVSISITEKNNLSGILRIESITLNKYLDSDGSVVNSEKIIPAGVEISGFKITAETSLDSLIDVSTISSLNNLNTTQATDTNIKNALYENRNEFFLNLPPSFSLDDISVSIVKKVSSEGKIIADISIAKYYDSNGIEKNSPLKKFSSVSITGFQKLDLETDIVDEESASVSGTPLSEIIPQDIKWDNIEMKKFIADNLVVNKGPNFNYENVIGFIVERFDNLSGTLEIYNISLSGNLLDENGDPKPPGTSSSFSKTITLNGFKTVKPTSQIENKINISNLSNTNINNITNEQIKQIVFNNLHNIISGLPEGINMDNINIAVNKKENNTIHLECQLNSYYDSQGVHITDSNYNFNLEIGGFYSNDYSIWWFIIICISFLSLILLIIWLATTSTKKKKIEVSSRNGLPLPPKSSNHLSHTPNVKKVSRNASVNNYPNNNKNH